MWEAFVKEVTASVAGERVEAVTCEKCRTAFSYELTRVGTGRASTVRLVGDGTGRAAAAAGRDLAARLDGEAELVACPKCNWVNQDLVDRYRRRLYRRAPRLIAALCGAVVFGFILALALTVDAYGMASWQANAARGGPVPACGLVVVGVLLARRTLRRRVDPNLTYPRVPTVPPGTPPALVERSDPRTGETRLVPAPRRAEVGRPVEWATFRPGQLRLPAVCCLCMGAATTTYAPPMAVNDRSDLAVPMCRPCRRSRRRRWWLALTLTAVGASVVGGGLAAVLPGSNATGRAILVTFATGVGAIVGIVVAGRVARPYRLAVVDRDRSIVRFRATNPAYTDRVATEVRRSEAAGRAAL